MRRELKRLTWALGCGLYRVGVRVGMRQPASSS